MWKCMNCSAYFYFPEIKYPDAGLILGVGILGMKKMNPVKFCPECMSTKIEKSKKSEEDTRC